MEKTRRLWKGKDASSMLWTSLSKIEEVLKKEQHQTDDPLLYREGVMNLLKVSRRSLKNWRNQRMIEFSGVGGKFYYRMSGIDRVPTKNLNTTKQFFLKTRGRVSEARLGLKLFL